MKRHVIGAGRSTRRRVAVAPRLTALVAAAVLALAALGAAAANARTHDTVNLTFWSFQDQSAEANLYNQTHPGVHVTAVQQAGGTDYYAKLQAALQAKNAPDVALVEYQFLPTIEAANGLVDLSKYGAASVKNDFVPWTWSQVSRGAAVYAIPRDTGPLGLYYRADVFKKYHLTVPKTWAQYAADAAKLHKANKSYYITDFPATEPGWFVGLIWQGGGQWFRTAGSSWKLGIDDGASNKVASYWSGLIDKHLVKTEPDFSNAWNADLSSGHLATWISAVWGTGFLSSAAPKAAGKWRVAALPQWKAGAQVYGNWGGAALGVTTSSQHPQQAAAFIEWLNTQSKPVQTTIDKSSLYPAAKAGLTSKTFSKGVAYLGGENPYPVFANAAGRVDTAFQWGPTMTQVYTDIGDAFSSAIAGHRSLGKALSVVQSKTAANMKQQGFSVASS